MKHFPKIIRLTSDDMTPRRFEFVRYADVVIQNGMVVKDRMGIALREPTEYEEQIAEDV